MNKSFIKVPRTKKESGNGKGGFWKLSSDCKKQRSLLHPQQELDSPQAKRLRHTKRSNTSNQILSKNSPRISHENLKNESWIDPILPCIASKSQSPLRCHTTIHDRSYIRMPSSFLFSYFLT